MPIVEAIRIELEKRAVPVELWTDITHLRPGQQWDIEIKEALESSVGALFFISRESAKSNWMRAEMSFAIRTPDRLIIPVLLDSNAHLPLILEVFQRVDLSEPSATAIASAADRIATNVESYLRQTPAPRSPVTPANSTRNRLER